MTELETRLIKEIIVGVLVAIVTVGVAYFYDHHHLGR